MKKYILTATSVILLAIILFWVGSIIKCEIITKMHGDEFLMFEEVSTASEFKILTYTNDFARVYCINFNLI